MGGGVGMKKGSEDFIRLWTKPRAHPFVPELTFFQAEEITPLWQALETWVGATNLPPPFWAFVWPGGAALARYVLDHPDLVRGKRVLDFASGSGIGALAVALAGAARVYAADIDPLSQIATQMNAAENRLGVETLGTVDLEKKPVDVEVILAGDVCYEQTMSVRVLRWLRSCAAAGVEVLLADPGRAYAPKDGTVELARYNVPVLRELEDRDAREVVLWRLGG